MHFVCNHWISILLFIFCSFIVSFLRVFHTNNKLDVFTELWVTASIHNFPGLYSEFKLISAVQWSDWSRLVLSSLVLGLRGLFQDGTTSSVLLLLCGQWRKEETITHFFIKKYNPLFITCKGRNVAGVRETEMETPDCYDWPHIFLTHVMTLLSTSTSQPKVGTGYPLLWALTEHSPNRLASRDWPPFLWVWDCVLYNIFNTYAFSFQFMVHWSRSTPMHCLFSGNHFDYTGASCLEIHNFLSLSLSVLLERQNPLYEKFFSFCLFKLLAWIWWLVCISKSWMILFVSFSKVSRSFF